MEKNKVYKGYKIGEKDEKKKLHLFIICYVFNYFTCYNRSKIIR